MIIHRLVRLGDHVELLSGFPFKSAKFTKNPRDTRLLRGDNIAQGNTRWENAAHWKENGDESARRFLLSPGDIVLAMDRPWIGAGLKWAYLTSDDVPSLLVQRVARLRSKEGLSQKFLRSVIAHPDFTNHIKSVTTGTNVPHISGPDILSYRFLLPPLSTQHRIASVLSAYDDLIENNTRRIGLLEEMARVLYREWFASPEAASRPGWAEKPLGEAMEINPKVKVSPETQQLPFVSMGGLSTTFHHVEITETRSKPSGARFTDGDTLVARITPCLENGKTGLVMGLGANVVACGSTEFIVLRSQHLGPEYVYLFARDEPFRARAKASMSGATGRQRVQERALLDIPVVVPPSEVIGRFRAIATPLFEASDTLNRTNHALRAARDLLLPKLLSGELSVDRIPDPAAVAP